MVDFGNSTSMAVSAASVEGTQCSFGGNLQTTPASSEMQPAKRKRNLPGMPDPDAEVVALSPTTLLATNRFVCEICNKGFQRDQNLQLHRRGHNLPWKLKQRKAKDIRKRVYVCPEKTCVHHDPLRALGDLTGIKKHFSRKHGEKKWNCERCSKKYAVQSDWKAHMKTCGTKEYRCDCGTMFSRRDSFITHRAFCDALAQESARSQTQALAISSPDTRRHEETSKVEPIVHPQSCSPPPPPLTPSTSVLSPVQSVHSSDLPETATEKVATATCLATNAAVTTTTTGGGNHMATNTTGVFASIFASSTISQPPQSSPASYSDLICAAAGVDRTTTIEPMSLSLSSSLYRSPTAVAAPPLFPPPDHRQYVQASQPAISATALLQKAAQMGSTSSNTSFLRALGLASTDAPNPDSMPLSSSALGLGLPSTGGREVLMGPSAPTTLDFLGLGMACGAAGGTGASTRGLSAFLTSMGGSRLDVSPASFGGMNSVHNDDWDDSDDRKPAHL